jgi:hypothetical protein
MRVLQRIMYREERVVKSVGCSEAADDVGDVGGTKQTRPILKSTPTGNHVRPCCPSSRDLEL